LENLFNDGAPELDAALNLLSNGGGVEDGGGVASEEDSFDESFMFGGEEDDSADVGGLFGFIETRIEAASSNCTC